MWLTLNGRVATFTIVSSGETEPSKGVHEASPKPLYYATPAASPPPPLDFPFRISCVACGSIGVVLLAAQAIANVAHDPEAGSTLLANVPRILRSLETPTLRPDVGFAVAYLLAAMSVVVATPLLLLLGIWPRIVAWMWGRIAVRFAGMLIMAWAIADAITQLDLLAGTLNGPRVRFVEAAGFIATTVAMHAAFALLVLSIKRDSARSLRFWRQVGCVVFAAIAFGAMVWPQAIDFVVSQSLDSAMGERTMLGRFFQSHSVHADFGASPWSFWPTRALGIASAFGSAASFVRPRDRPVLWGLPAVPLFMISGVCVLGHTLNAISWIGDSKSGKAWSILMAVAWIPIEEFLQQAMLAAFALILIAKTCRESAIARSLNPISLIGR